MTNEEMMRPCTLWGQTFDAIKVRSVDQHPTTGGETVHIEFLPIGVCPDADGNYKYKSQYFFDMEEESRGQSLHAITTIADALNAPVLATEEVLEGLTKDANALAVLSGNMCRMKWVEDEDGGYWQIRDGDYYMNVAYEDFGDSYFPIKADNCFKTAEYLLQFTLDGKRKETV